MDFLKDRKTYIHADRFTFRYTDLHTYRKTYTYIEQNKVSKVYKVKETKWKEFKITERSQTTRHTLK